MSIIDKLSIKGIRSFGIKPEDQQVIIFSSPLTLIVGSNGSGKTTIIECLKYALTGELPPGSDKGKSFVHDPKIFGCPECLGQVKLQVKNLRDDKLTIARSIKTAFKRGKAVFETIDPGTITYGDGSTTKGSISMRCVDVNKEMCQFMGVSKAIMNNVLFCHQEESDWPLDEAKKLKEKFDAIFGTTEYNKAIDKIIKMRKLQQGKLKEREADLKICQHFKKQTDEKQLALQNKEQELEELKGDKKKYENEMQPVQNRIQKINEIEFEAGKLQSKKIELKTNLERYKEQSKSLKAKINSVFVGDIAALEEEIRVFKPRMIEKKIELKTSQSKFDKLKGEYQKLLQASQAFDRERTTLINERQKEQEYLSDRANKIKSLCNELKIKVDGDLEQSASYVDSIMSEIASSFDNREQEISNAIKDHEDADRELQKKIDKLREEKASLESNVKSKSDDKSRILSERQKIETEIGSIEKSAQGIKKLDEQIETVNKTYEELLQQVNRDSLKSHIDQNKELIDNLTEKYEKLDKTVDFLNSISKLTSEIDLKKNELEKRDSEIQRVRNKHSENFKNIFGSLVESNFKRTLQDKVNMLQNQIADLTKQINTKKLFEKELQLRRKNQKDEITKLEKELEDSNDRIYDHCHSTPYEDVLAATKDAIELFQLDHGALKSSEAMYKKYIKKVEENPCCPLCHKNMTNNEASDLRTELSDEIHRLPDRIERAERQLKSESKKYEELLGLRSVIERKKILETNIPKSKENLKRTEEQLTAVTKDIESLQITESEPSALLELARNMLGDMSLLDEAMKETTRLTSELEALKGKLPERTDDMSLEEAQLEKSSVAKSLKEEHSRSRDLSKRHLKETEMLNKLREKKNDLKEQQIKLQERVQKLQQLKTRITEIKTQIEEIGRDIKGYEDKLKPTKSQLETLERQKDKLKDDNRKIVQEMEKKLGLLRRTDQDIKRFTDELNELEKKNLVEEIDRVKRKIMAHNEEKKAKEKEIQGMQELIENLKSDISNQEIQERDLMDNKEYKLLLKTQLEFQEKYDELSKDLGDLDFSNLRKERTELAMKRDKINEQTGVISGKMGEVNNTINGLRKELNKPEYRDSMKNYRKGLYEVQVLKKLIADLAQYRSALDYSLIKFHEEKMNKINRLIREFWRQIYRGNDIDYIQIKTEADEMKNEAADKRRSYNYRVIQSKNNSEIDMRGRCSAGQRVLSSLIIRMALAETFSSNCGVLALDEPTTNLDRNNIHSLCEALNKIVDERQTQSNFMLIIITHDEEFIQTLGQVSTYHQVSRNVDGKSVILKKRIQ